MKRLFLVFLCVFFSTLSLAHTVKTFMPENNLNEVDGLLIDNGMTEELFNSIIAEVENYYAPIVNGYGADLIINRLWSNSTVNAQAYQEGDTWYVDMFGGLARRPEVTPDGFAMVVCHEVGHHLAGWPYVQSWAANEGQSDYFAMHACAKGIWAKQANKVDSIDPIAKKLCDQNLTSTQDYFLCYREMNAGYSLATLLAALGGTKASFSTPDKTIVSKTSSVHPNAQCRLDTYVAGTLCATVWDDNVIPTTEAQSAKYLCINKSSTGYSIQARPRCWFKPKI